MDTRLTRFVLDTRLVLETQLIFETRLLFETRLVLEVLWYNKLLTTPPPPERYIICGRPLANNCNSTIWHKTRQYHKLIEAPGFY